VNPPFHDDLGGNDGVFDCEAVVAPLAVGRFISVLSVTLFFVVCVCEGGGGAI